MTSSSSSLLRRARMLETQSFYEFFGTVVECSELLKNIQPIKRRPWLADVVTEMYESQNGKCAICDKELEYGTHEVDHVIPFCYGGGNEKENLQLTCMPCNRKKGKSVAPLDLLKYLEDRSSNI